MPEKSTVLVYTTALRPFIGGSEIALEENVRHLPSIFFEIFTPRCRRGLSPKEHSGNFCVHRIGLGFSGDKYLFPAVGFLASLGALKKTKIIHSYQASFGGGAAFLAKLFFPKKKLIVTLQEGEDLDRQNFLIRTARRMILKKADVITVISSYLKNYAVSENKRAKVVLIPNGVDLTKFQSDQERNRKTIITVSRLVEKNGVAHLVKAMKRVVKEVPDAKLLIVGSGPEEKWLKGLVADLGLGKSAEFLGEICYEDIPDYLSRAGLFVRPSLSEGLGSAFLEAMAAGLAVIGTPVGGIPDFLRDRETGLFCKLGDPDDLAEKIVELVRNDELRNRLAVNGRKLVEEKYSWDKIAGQFAHLYESI